MSLIILSKLWFIDILTKNQRNKPKPLMVKCNVTFQRPMADKSSCYADKPSGCGPDTLLLGEATIILHAMYQIYSIYTL